MNAFVLVFLVLTVACSILWHNQSPRPESSEKRRASAKLKPTPQASALSKEEPTSARSSQTANDGDLWQ